MKSLLDLRLHLVLHHKPPLHLALLQRLQLLQRDLHQLLPPVLRSLRHALLLGLALNGGQFESEGLFAE